MLLVAGSEQRKQIFCSLRNIHEQKQIMMVGEEFLSISAVTGSISINFNSNFNSTSINIQDVLVRGPFSTGKKARKPAEKGPQTETSWILV